MLEKYKIIVIKKYDFTLDGKNEKIIKQQADYIINQTNILEMPYVKKKTRIKIKKINEREKRNERNN